MNSNTVSQEKSSTRRSATRKPAQPRHGLGQLTLVEHALCPLDARTSLEHGLVHHTSFQYSDAKRRRQTAHVEVSCPHGLSAHDEFYLWGLLALTLSQPQSGSEFHATPHYCLRQLGLIDTKARRGGRQYQQFAAAIERLSWVKYGCDAFYDPMRAEHCRVRFSFLSYRLPIDPQSSRVWRFHWDAQFLEFVKSAGGSLWFDLELYRSLSPAGRRLFLFISKVFARSQQTPRLDLKQIAIEILGLSAQLPTKHLLAKTRRVCEELIEAGLIMEHQRDLIQKRAAGEYDVLLRAGNAVRQQPGGRLKPVDSPLMEPLQAIGLDPAGIARVLRQFPHERVREWADITLAARERFGLKFFKRSPMAYLIDNLKKSASDGRTPPDWWHDIRRAEERRWASRATEPTNPTPTRMQAIAGRSEFEQVRSDLVQAFRATGLDDESATLAAEREARRRMQRSNSEPSDAMTSVKDVLVGLPLKLL
ncbi:MAG: hypothetical protein R3C18_02755 [Planctomycetaceae bacterium]